MNLLLDTHVLLWMFGDSARLSEAAGQAILDEANHLCFSIAGYWEIGIKQSFGKLVLSEDWQELIPREMARNRVAFLPIRPAHVHQVATLPWLHRDPVDRIVVAQALVEFLTVITADSSLAGYGVPLLW